MCRAESENHCQHCTTEDLLLHVASSQVPPCCSTQLKHGYVSQEARDFTGLTTMLNGQCEVPEEACYLVKVTTDPCPSSSNFAYANMFVADRFCPGKPQPVGTPSNVFVGRCGGDEPPFWHKKKRSRPRVPACSVSGTQSEAKLAVQHLEV